jgi:hypothetical protein
MTAARARRKFRLSDAMVLIAGVGLGFGWLRFMMNGGTTAWNFLSNSPEAWAFYLHLKNLPILVVPLMPCLAVLTLILTALRLLPPRPSLRRLATRPGSVALFVASVALLVSSTAAGCRAINTYNNVSPSIGWFTWVSQDIFWLGVGDAAAVIAYATIVAWSVQLLIRRCLPERTWIDRVGIAVGIAWIFAAGCVWWFDRILGGPGAYFWGFN